MVHQDLGSPSRTELRTDQKNDRQRQDEHEEDARPVTKETPQSGHSDRPHLHRRTTRERTKPRASPPTVKAVRASSESVMPARPSPACRSPTARKNHERGVRSARRSSHSLPPATGKKVPPTIPIATARALVRLPAPSGVRATDPTTPISEVAASVTKTKRMNSGIGLPQSAPIRRVVPRASTDIEKIPRTR